MKGNSAQNHQQLHQFQPFLPLAPMPMPFPMGPFNSPQYAPAPQQFGSTVLVVKISQEVVTLEGEEVLEEEILEKDFLGKEEIDVFYLIACV